MAPVLDDVADREALAVARRDDQPAQQREARGASIMWAGDARAVAFGELSEGDWDYAALVWYPRPAAFADMMSSAEYAVGNVERENGTERHLILAMREGFSKLVPVTR